MALFGKKKNTEKVEKKAVVSSNKPATKKDFSNVIKHPRVTEKAAILGEVRNAYTFDVSKDATKNDIKTAVEKIYKVSPVKVNITKIAYKKVLVRGQRNKYGYKNGGKKAVVYLKKGDKIQFV